MKSPSKPRMLSHRQRMDLIIDLLEACVFCSTTSLPGSEQQDIRRKLDLLLGDQAARRNFDNDPGCKP